MDDTQIVDRISYALLARRGITWQPDEKYMENVTQAVTGAVSFLRTVSGNPALDFTSGEDFDLAVTAAWYFIENRRAEFQASYSADLNWIRLREAFGCGKDADTGVSG